LQGQLVMKVLGRVENLLNLNRNTAARVSIKQEQDTRSWEILERGCSERNESVFASTAGNKTLYKVVIFFELQNK
jgi:hypothetical protein